ncbi:hypothetical protein [Flavobacterium faecale]
MKENGISTTLDLTTGYNYAYNESFQSIGQNCIKKPPSYSE